MSAKALSKALAKVERELWRAARALPAERVSERRRHEGKMQPIFFLRSVQQILGLATFWTLTRSWADAINAWDHSDELSKTYSHLLEARPRFCAPVRRRHPPGHLFRIRRENERC